MTSQQNEILHAVLRSGSSFALGIRLAPAASRPAMAALYAFCRAVDDLADAPQAAPAVTAHALAGWRAAAVARFVADGSDGLDGPPPALRRALAAAVHRHALDPAPFVAVVDGVAMDLPPGLNAPDEATFTLYCRRVAGAVGEALVGIMGCPQAAPYALAVGEALQITNILRDLHEDAALGRLYLPAPDLAAAGIPAPWTPQAVLAHPALPQVCERLARRAAACHDRAATLFRALPAADRRRLRIAWLMSAIYAALLARLRRRGWQDPSARVRPSSWRIGLLVAQSYLWLR